MYTGERGTSFRGIKTLALEAEGKSWRDPLLPLESRARGLLSALTLDEKIGLLHGNSKFSTAGVPRLGIPERWLSDGPCGVREEVGPHSWNAANRTDDFATAMPANLALAATFDLVLAQQYGQVLGEEAVTRDKHILLAPGVNIMRTPLNGRNGEYLGEDPHLAARMAVSYIRAVQSQGVAACVKHFALNNQETERTTISVEVDEKALHEIYLPAFKAAVVEASVWCVMTGYNRVRGDYCAENAYLLNTVLKEEWGFQGLVMSDWNGAHSTVKAAHNGLDLEMGTELVDYDQYYFAQPLKTAVQAGALSQERLDQMVLRNLRVMIATGLADPPRQRGGKLMSPQHLEVARRVHESGCVLLKNTRGVLPLDAATTRRIAVIGSNAILKFAYDGSSARIKTAREVTPLEGLQRRAGAGIVLEFVPGYAVPAKRDGGQTAGKTDTELLTGAVEAARRADVVIVVAGLYRWEDQECADRPHMDLPPGQARLIEEVTAANANTVVVLTGGGPVSMDPWEQTAAAIMQYWYGGSEGGTALARLLFGDVNPCGKLPCTFPARLADAPAHCGGEISFPGKDGRQIYGEGELVGYRWFDTKEIQPRYPFGFGLSYTRFDISDMQLIPGKASPDAGDWSLDVQVTVANTGSRSGAEVVQIYVESPREQQTVLRQLRGFSKVFLEPGERRAVRIPLAAAAFSHFDSHRRAWVTSAGTYAIHAGNSSRNLPCRLTFKMDQNMILPAGT